MFVCFLLNNLLFTYSTKQISLKKSEDTNITCQSEDDCCLNPNKENSCCEEGNCCANLPSNHLNFSVIIGVDKKNEMLVSIASMNTFNLSELNSDAQLSDGYLSSLIKPPAFT